MSTPHTATTAADGIETSYKLQAISETKMAMPSRYTAPDTIDCWRHTRMQDSVRALVRTRPQARWVTVGDGRFGSDAAYLKSLGAQAMATSLTDERLRQAHEAGYIDAYRAENAEALSFGNGEYDFVYCKEAYHHFPRPPIALYEMLRVARLGVVLIEPQESQRPLDRMKKLVKRLIRGDSEFEFEPSGNFLYRINVREIGKLMCAMGHLTLAHKGLNDFYHPRLGAAKTSVPNKAFTLTKLGIGVQDALCSTGLLGHGLCAVVVFNGEAPADLRQALQADGYTLLDLPRNPYA